ncbi:MAG: hypothetical protein JW755_04015 [Candidatus Aminicenantes bacterium]|nr:hypothetical protein [Candidatus Aminicenantes bacterium]
MNRKSPGFSLAAVILIGSIWGLSEAALGMGLRKCASSVSGSLMTGAAFFFIAAAWTISRRYSSVFLVVLIASLFKLFDAALLSLPVLHGAIANPIFAIIMEGIAFAVIAAVIQKKLKEKIPGQALFGGLAALVAVNLFPLVRFATGIPACTAAGTGYPLSLYYAYVAVAASMITLPLGVWVGSRIASLEYKLTPKLSKAPLRYIISPAAIILCLVIVALIRSGS